MPAVLALKQVYTTPQTLYDRPTPSDLRRLLAPVPEPFMTTSGKQSWEEAFWGMSPEHRQRALTQRLTALWEDASGKLVAYALIAQPGSSLTFQVHPEAQMQAIAQAHGVPRELWCRCHEVERARRSLLEAAGFLPLPERDLRLVHPLDTPKLAVSLSGGFSLQRGVQPSEFDMYQELHQAVFDGISMGMDYHQSSAYQLDLDLITREPTGRFGALCQCAASRMKSR